MNKDNRYSVLCIVGSLETINFLNNSSEGVQQARAGIPSCELATVMQYVKEERKDAGIRGSLEFIFHHLFSSVCSW